MMKRTMRKWFHFDGSDAKTAEAWLNRLGAEGWGLAALAWGLGSDGREASGGLHPAMPCDRIGADWKSFSQECELRWKTFSLSTPACVESAPAR